MGDEFTAHLAELTTPNTEGFDFFTESKTVGYTVRIFRYLRNRFKNTSQQDRIIYNIFYI